MSGRYILSPRAKADIDKIWTDTAKKWGIDQAETYIRQIAHHLQFVADRPSIGRACPEVRVGYHKLSLGFSIVRSMTASTWRAGMDFKQHV